MLYFIFGHQTRLVKIGKAVNPGERLRALQVGSPDVLTILAVLPDTDDEAPFHERYRTSRVHGEWFRLTSKLLDFIRGVPLTDWTGLTLLDSEKRYRDEIKWMLPPQGRLHRKRRRTTHSDYRDALAQARVLCRKIREERRRSKNEAKTAKCGFDFSQLRPIEEPKPHCDLFNRIDRPAPSVAATAHAGAASIIPEPLTPYNGSVIGGGGLEPTTATFLN